MTDASTSAPIEVFTQRHCASCRRVERYLRDLGVPFEVRDVTSDAAALDEIFKRGFMTTPVTRIGDQWIAGFKRKKFEQLLNT